MVFNNTLKNSLLGYNLDVFHIYLVSSLKTGVVPPSQGQWGMLSKTPSGCLKPWTVPNSIYAVFFPITTCP